VVSYPAVDWFRDMPMSHSELPTGPGGLSHILGGGTLSGRQCRPDIISVRYLSIIFYWYKPRKRTTSILEQHEGFHVDRAVLLDATSRHHQL